MVDTAKIGCKEFRDKLEKRVLAQLEAAERVQKLSTKMLMPDSTAVVADVEPFASAKEADAAEMNINWFSPSQADICGNQGCSE